MPTIPSSYPLSSTTTVSDVSVWPFQSIASTAVVGPTHVILRSTVIEDQIGRIYNDLRAQQVMNPFVKVRLDTQGLFSSFVEPGYETSPLSINEVTVAGGENVSIEDLTIDTQDSVARNIGGRGSGGGSSEELPPNQKWPLN